MNSKIWQLFTLFFGVFLLVLSGCNPKVGIEAEKAAAQAVVNQMLQAFEAEDMELFAKITAHESDMINSGTDAAERWVGWDALKEAVATVCVI